MIVYVDDYKVYKKANRMRLARLQNTIKMQKSIVFLYTSNKQSEIEIKNTVASKNI